MNVVCFVFALLVTGIFPAAMLIGLLAGKRRYLKGYLAGMATFLVFQILIRVPILNWMSSMGWQSILFLKSPWLYALFLGFTAALFEAVSYTHLYVRERADRTEAGRQNEQRGAFKAAAQNRAETPQAKKDPDTPRADCRCICSLPAYADIFYKTGQDGNIQGR